MKNLVAFLLCLIMILSLFSCMSNENQNDLSSNENTSLFDVNDDSTDDDNTTLQLSKAEIAMEMYDAAIKGEICVFDERSGEVKLGSLRFSSNGTSLDECKLLTNAILDIDQDGIKEYVIKSPTQEHIILRYSNGKVYSYWLDACDFYSFNTDGTFYWCNSPESSMMTCGLNRIVFDGEAIIIKSIYSLKYSENPTKYEYFVGGESVTEHEYDDCRNSLRKEMMEFSQFELTCSYPITSEQAWNLANAYWDNRDGLKDHAAGTVFTHRIVLIDTPNSDSDYYRVALQVELSSNGGRAGDECMPPYDMQLKDQILVNAFTGDIIAPTDSPSDDGVSVDEAIKIADEYWGCINGKTDAACGTTLLCRVVVSGDPNPTFPFYQISWQVEYYSNCESEGHEDGSPYNIETYKEVFVNIYTGKCRADTELNENE